jgi:hypothetical protein
MISVRCLENTNLLSPCGNVQSDPIDSDASYPSDNPTPSIYNVKDLVEAESDRSSRSDCEFITGYQVRDSVTVEKIEAIFKTQEFGNDVPLILRIKNIGNTYYVNAAIQQIRLLPFPNHFSSYFFKSPFAAFVELPQIIDDLMDSR